MTRNLIRQKDLKYYLGLAYPVQLTHLIEDDEEYWLAEILDLPGCMSDGDDPNEALENIEDAKRLWIETRLEDGYEVPEPTPSRQYSGKFLVRVPKSLHSRLAMQAKREGLSLNQLVVSLLSNRESDSKKVRRIEATLENLKAV